MRILVLAPQPFYQPRGTPIAVRLLVTELARQGHRLTVLTLHEGEDVAIPGVDVVRLPRLPGTGGMAPGLSWKKVVCDLALTVAALRLLGRERYDVVHAVEEGCFVALWCRWRRGTPYVYDMDSSLSQQVVESRPWLRPLRPLLRRCETAAIRRSTGVLAVCRALETDVLARVPGALVATVEDTSLLAAPPPGAPPAGSGTPAAAALAHVPRPRVVYVGNLEPYQGIDLLLAAFAGLAGRLPLPSLVLVGGSPARIAEYARRAAALGLTGRVHLLGPRPLEQLGDYLREADVLVSPRLGGDNTPMKIYSYLAAGRAIVATQLPTHTQVLDDTVARLVAPRPAALAEALEALFADPVGRRRLGAAAAARAREAHGPEAFAAGIAGFYARVATRLGLPAAAPESVPWAAAQ